MYTILITKSKGTTERHLHCEGVTVLKENEAGQATNPCFTLHGDGTVTGAIKSDGYNKMNFHQMFCDAERKTYQAFHRSGTAKIRVLGFMDIEVGFSSYPAEPSVGIMNPGIDEWWIESAPIHPDLYDDLAEYLENLEGFNIGNEIKKTKED